MNQPIKRDSAMWILLVGLLLLVCVYSIDVPENLLEQAIAFAQSQNEAEIVDQLQQHSIHALHHTARAMMQQTNREPALQILHILAEDDHFPSQMALGSAYAEAAPQLAIKYFVDAAEATGNGGAMYNAGKMLYEQGDLVKALAYLRAVPEDSASIATATHAYQLVSTDVRQQLPRIGLQQIVDMFPYASWNDNDKGWDDFMTLFQAHKWEQAQAHLNKLRVRRDWTELQIDILKFAQSIVDNSIRDEL